MEDKKALKAEMKTRKKAYKKAKRKYIQPWKALSQIFAFFMVIMVLVCFIANMADNTFAIITLIGTFNRNVFYTIRLRNLLPNLS